MAPSVSDGVVSAGEWAGPDTPTAAVDTFYLARDRAVASGAVAADLSQADIRSHDAVLALVGASMAARSTTPGNVLDALRTFEHFCNGLGHTFWSGQCARYSRGVPPCNLDSTTYGPSVERSSRELCKTLQGRRITYGDLPEHVFEFLTVQT